MTKNKKLLLASQGAAGMPTNTPAHLIWSASSNDTPIYIRIPIVIAVPNPPAAPTGLTATAQPDSSVSLTWANDATNASAVKIWRSVAGGFFSEIAWVPAGIRTANCISASRA
jgi:hypothetical protein